MIKQAIEYIVNLGNTEIFHENNQSYATQPVHLLEEAVAAKLNVRSLTGLVEYLKSEFDGKDPIMVHVESPTEVTAFLQLNTDRNREHLVKANALLPQFYFEDWYDTEEFNIKLQSAFVQNEDRDVVLRVVGNIREEDVKTFGDNGVSQSVTAKTGVAQVGNVEVPNPVLLKPYRTFVEVDQPESNFVFRMKNGPSCALFEADGGKWKLAAMQNIKEFLHKELAEEIANKKVVVIA